MVAKLNNLNFICKIIMKSKKDFSYYALALLATVLWGSAFPWAKIAFEYISSILVSGLRFFIAGLLLLPFMFCRGRLNDLKLHWKFILLFGLLQNVLQYSIFYCGLDYVPSSISAIVRGAVPLFVVVMSLFLLPSKSLCWRKIVALLVGFCGVVLICIGDKSIVINNPNFYWGILLLFISNIVGAYSNITLAKCKDKPSPIALTFGANLAGGAMLCLLSLLIDPQCFNGMITLPNRFWVAMILLSIIPAIGFTSWHSLLSRKDVNVSELNVFKFIIPVVGVLLSWALLPDEHPSFKILFSIAIVVGAVITIQRVKE